MFAVVAARVVTNLVIALTAATAVEIGLLASLVLSTLPRPTSALANVSAVLNVVAIGVATGAAAPPVVLASTDPAVMFSIFGNCTIELSINVVLLIVARYASAPTAFEFLT